MGRDVYPKQCPYGFEGALSEPAILRNAFDDLPGVSVCLVEYQGRIDVEEKTDGMK